MKFLSALVVFLTTSSSTCMAFQQLSMSQQQIHSIRSRLYQSSSNTNDPATSSTQEPTVSKVDLPEGSNEELLYALGVNLARQLGDVRPLVESGDELAQLAKGVLDTLIGRLEESGQQELLLRRGADLKQLVAVRAQKIQDGMAEAGQNMMKEMSQTEGAVTLPSGVILHILEKSPTDSTVRATKASSVKIHYHGTLADGTIFDSTLGGEPVVLPLAGVIPGWREAVLKMNEGETAMVGIPPEFAYGADGTPDGRIPPNCPIFFKVQLLQVLSASIGGGPSLLGADGQKLDSSSGGLLGADGKPMV